MNKSLDEALSFEIAQSIKSKAKKPFDNAYKAALSIGGAMYVQGFLVVKGMPYQPIEHAWIEIDDKIVDPTLPRLDYNFAEVWYFGSHILSVKKLKAIIEESQEDYPEDDPFPIYGDAPYEYYGNVMLGGKEYLQAFETAMVKCKEVNQPQIDNN